MNHYRFSLLVLLVALAACNSSSSSSSSATTAASPHATAAAASAPNDRTALVGTWACTGTIHGKTSIRGYYLTLRADGTGAAQIKLPNGSTPLMPLKQKPWWGSFHAGTLTWEGANHWTITNFPSGQGLSMDCVRA